MSMPKKPESKSKRGRPPLKAGAAKRASFNTRLREAVKERLEKEASDAGRSLSEEIEFRLERSFERERTLQELLEVRFGPELARLLITIGRDATSEVARAGSSFKDIHSPWLDDPAAFNAAQRAIENALAIVNPSNGERRASQSYLFSVRDRGVNDIGGFGEFLRRGLTELTVSRIIARGSGLDSGDSEQ